MIPKLTDVLSDETKWTQGTFARDAEGTSCGWSSPTAACWCLDGALGTLPSRRYEEYRKAVCHAIRKLHPTFTPDEPDDDFVVSFNDAPGRTFAEVYAVAKRADEILAQGATP